MQRQIDSLIRNCGPLKLNITIIQIIIPPSYYTEAKINPATELCNLHQRGTSICMYIHDVYTFQCKKIFVFDYI